MIYFDIDRDVMVSIPKTKMDKEQLILACLAAAEGGSYDPAQIQKLVFLYQQKGLASSDLKPFSFKPYNFGPFDPAVYNILESLEERGLVEIQGEAFSKGRSYSLARNGQTLAASYLAIAPSSDYLKKLSAWVRGLSFTDLVAAVYKAFPEMKVNSVFRD